jgi:phosphoribosylglycinamide formyltransferase 1
MARLAVFASGRGTNFVSIAMALKAAGRHRIELLLCDVAGAPVLQRAEELGVPTFPVSYEGQQRQAVEKKIVRHLERRCVDLVALAGFMKLLTPYFLDAFKGPVINLHPSLLPKYPGTHAIDESYASGDRELGITIMRVDAGVDTGPAILQKSFTRDGTEGRDIIETRIHDLEHEWFPKVLIGLLDGIDTAAAGGGRT